jgi:L-malate glycosyltransferase
MGHRYGRLLLLGNPNSPHLLKVIYSLQDEFREIHIYSIHQSHCRSVELNNIANCSVELITLPFARFDIPLLFKYLLGGIYLRFLLLWTTSKNDKVNAHYASGYGLLATIAFWPKPFYVSIWGSDITEFPHRSIFHKFLLGFVLRSSSSILVTSKFLRDEVLKTFPSIFSLKKIYLTPFCVQDEFFDIGSQRVLVSDFSGSVVIGFAKSLKPIYNLELLMLAYSQLLGMLNEAKRNNINVPDIKLSVAGGGLDLPRYQELALTLGISDSVTFCGALTVKEMPLFMSSIDIYMAVSAFESFGVSALEASAAAVPVISSGVGGLSEIVIDKKTGVVLEELTVNAISKELYDLILNPLLRRSYGICAFHYAYDNYSMSTMKDSFVSAFA